MSATNGAGRIVECYPYNDATGKLLYEVVRFDPKDFRQRTPDGQGRWRWGLNGTAPVLYRLDRLANADPGSSIVFITEGEKDVHSLEALGLLATTAPMGAGKWRPSYNQWLRGFHVVILADNDELGLKYADAVAATLAGIAESVTIVSLPGLPHKGDVTDWLAQSGNDRAKLLDLCEVARKEQRFRFTPGDAYEPPEDRLPRDSANGKSSTTDEAHSAWAAPQPIPNGLLPAGPAATKALHR
jgi:putative DNA primase/helicase